MTSFCKAGFRLLAIFSGLQLSPVITLGQSVCNNADFEQSSPSTLTSSLQVAGWTVTKSYGGPGNDNCNMNSCCSGDPVASEIVNTTAGHIDQKVGNVYPFYSVFGPGQNTAGLSYNPQLKQMGGSSILRLHNYAYYSILSEQATKTITVTPSSSVLKLAYCIILMPEHLCCDGAGFRLAVSTSSCVLVNTNSCPSTSLVGFYNGLTGLPATPTSSLIFSKWKVRLIDLSQFMGQQVTFSVTASRCTLGFHDGCAYVDAECDNSFLAFNGTPLTNTTSIVSASACNTAFTISAAPYFDSYLWKGPNNFQSANHEIVTNVGGSYTVELGQENCPPIIKVIKVTQPPPINILSSGTLCVGQSATLTANGAASYTWQSNASNLQAIQVSPTTTTVYYVSGTTTNNCLVSGEFTVDPEPLPELTAVFAPTVCAGTSQTLSASGANTYEWLDNNGFQSVAQNPLFIAPSVAGIIEFTLTGKSLPGCEASARFTIQVMPLPVPSLTITPAPTVCPGTEVKFLTAGGRNYEWTGPLLFHAYGKEVVFNAEEKTHDGTYIVKVTDDFGCASEDSLLLTVITAPKAIIDGGMSGCTPFCTTLTAVSQPASNNNVQVYWKDGGFVVHGKDIRRCFPNPGHYSIILNLKDTGTGCTSAQTTEVNAYPAPVAGFTTFPEVPTEFSGDIELVNSTTGNEITQQKWHVPSRVNLVNHGGTTFIRVDEAGIYPVALHVRNKWGCEDTIVKPIVVAEDAIIYIPDAFTPNDDGANDFFKPVSRGGVTYTMAIFDRWGKKIFDTDHTSPGWDGTYNGSRCQAGVYACLFTLQDGTRSPTIIQKKVSLIR